MLKFSGSPYFIWDQNQGELVTYHIGAATSSISYANWLYRSTLEDHRERLAIARTTTGVSCLQSEVNQPNDTEREEQVWGNTIKWNPFSKHKAKINNPKPKAPQIAVNLTDRYYPQRVWVLLELILKEACSKGFQGAQFAFKSLMIHWVLQFALRIAFRCVLHRCENQDIHC